MTCRRFRFVGSEGAARQRAVLPQWQKNGILNPPSSALRSSTMTTKEFAVKAIQQMPDTTTWEEIEERIRFLAAIEKGRREIRDGKVVPHQEVKDRLQSWISA